LKPPDKEEGISILAWQLTASNPDRGFPDTLDEHIHNAWKNVETALKAAGGKGWEEVYSVTTYHCPMSEESLGIAVKYMKQYAPHKPLWTAVGVAALAHPKMKIEVAVKAKSQW
jgi:non-canonical poly(A) RNA polymerase PAPD5/7